jgi:hypothetical protein
MKYTEFVKANYDKVAHLPVKERMVQLGQMWRKSGHADKKIHLKGTRLVVGEEGGDVAGGMFIKRKGGKRGKKAVGKAKGKGLFSMAKDYVRGGSVVGGKMRKVKGKGIVSDALGALGLGMSEGAGVKKRGRKPKGGKIIQQIVPLNNNKETKPNVILHLKCSLKDLHMNKILYNSDIQSFDFSNANHLTYDIIKSENTTFNKPEVLNIQNDKYSDDENDYEDNSTKENDIRDIWKKLKNLEHNLHINSICDKKSACFWCTCDFDNPPVYIPKHFIKESYHVYGCFCSPECATAHLMEENIDSSAKFERYHLINNIYAKIYDYKKNIKPAPNPYYMLDKYYGNLTIQEYRSLLKNERLFLVVDKPLTRILPELHQDNDDFIINNKIIPSNTFQMKKKLLQKKKTKNNILSEQFGLNQ